MNDPAREDGVTLGLLQAIEQRSDVTQRHLADRLGIALGLANAYLRRCVRKGLIKVQQAPANRYLYYLTPKGFAEKSRLTAQYLADSLEIYRRASEDYARIYSDCEANGLSRVICCGASELAEIASIRARTARVEILGILDPDPGLETFLHLPVWHSVRAAAPCDALVLTALSRQAEMLDWLGNEAGPQPLLIPRFLGFLETHPAGRTRQHAVAAGEN